jgi:hypothetical protein
MIPGELRAHVASASDFGTITTELSESIVLATPPSPRDALRLARATRDDKNRGAALLLNDPTRRYAHSSSVDNTGNAHIRSRIVGAITNSILSAYVVFGFPSMDRRAPCLNPFKWTPHVGFTMPFLGYLLDTRTMTVQWPEDKHAQLAAMLDEEWLAPSLGRKPSLPPRNIARPLGLIRHGALVSVIGTYLSSRLQHSLNDAIRAQALRGKVTKRWWHTARVRIPHDAMPDICLIRVFLAPDGHNLIWTRPIGLLIPRTPTITPISDACYGGLGGWAQGHPLIWRLNKADLEACGFILLTG